MTEANFWDYATNEKCQDAFICYLLGFEESRKELFKCCEIEHDKWDKGSVYLQYKSMDIFLETDKSLLIIEDKVNTIEHDEQLKRYVEKVQNKGKKVHVCYIKSGYLSRKEERNIKAGLRDFSLNLHFINLQELLKIAKSIEKKDTVIEQWIKKNEEPAKLQDDFLKEIQRRYNSDILYDKVFNNKEYNRYNNTTDWLRCYLHPYLDTLTEEIRKYTVKSEIYSKDTYWSVEGVGYTAHVGLKGTERKKVRNKNCWTSYSLYVMFRQEGPKLVLKQHFYDSKEKGNRIGTKKYSSLGLKTAKDKISIPTEWEEKSERSDEKLMLCEKLLTPTDNLVEVLKDEKENIKEIFKELG